MKRKIEGHEEEIVAKYTADVPVSQIAADLGVTKGTIYNWINLNFDRVRRLKPRRAKRLQRAANALYTKEEK